MSGTRECNMQFKIPTTYLAGLAAYAALIGLSATPFLPWPLAGVQLMQLAIAGGLASLLVGAMLVLGLDELVKDPAACFTQALLGMGISMALYTRISGDIRPEVLDVALVWIAIGVSHLGVVRTAVLLAIYFGLYGFTTYPDLLSGNDLDRGQALYGLGVSVIVSGVLYSRARHYAHINEHKQLHAAKLEEAE